MGTFYDGARVHVEGTAPSQTGILVVIRGVDKDEYFNRKGRVGIIWLNADRIHIKQAPSLFLVFSSGDSSSLLDRGGLDAYRLDVASIRKHARCLCHCKCSLVGGQAEQNCKHGVAPDPAYDELLRTSFIALKQSEGSYREYPNAVTLAPLPGADSRYSVEFQWPRKAPPGDYQVEVYACRDHGVVARSAATLQLVEVGFPAYIAGLASRRPWLYGLGAVLVAMLAGFGIDALSTRLRRGRHGARTKSQPVPPAAPTAASAKPAASQQAAVESEEPEKVHHH